MSETTAPAIDVVCKVFTQLIVEDAERPGNYIGIVVDPQWWENATPAARDMIWKGLASDAQPKLVQARAEQDADEAETKASIEKVDAKVAEEMAKPAPAQRAPRKRIARKAAP